MQLRCRDLALQPVDSRVAAAQLAHEPLPLVFKLPYGHANFSCSGRRELGTIKRVAPGHRFSMHRRQIGIDGRARSAAGAEALELRVVAVADGAPVENMAREERFAP